MKLSKFDSKKDLFFNCGIRDKNLKSDIENKFKDTKGSEKQTRMSKVKLKSIPV